MTTTRRDSLTAAVTAAGAAINPDLAHAQDQRLSDPEAMLARKEACAEAYRRTPHGKPVELPNGSR